MMHRHPDCVICGKFVDFVEQVQSFILIDGCSRLFYQLVKFFVVIPCTVCRADLVRVQVGIEELTAVSSTVRPADECHLIIASCRFFQECAPLHHLNTDIESCFHQLCLDNLTHQHELALIRYNPCTRCFI